MQGQKFVLEGGVSDIVFQEPHYLKINVWTADEIDGQEGAEMPQPVDTRDEHDPAGNEEAQSPVDDSDEQDSVNDADRPNAVLLFPGTGILPYWKHDPDTGLLHVRTHIPGASEWRGGPQIPEPTAKSPAEISLILPRVPLGTLAVTGAVDTRIAINGLKVRGGFWVERETSIDESSKPRSQLTALEVRNCYLGDTGIHTVGASAVQISGVRLYKGGRLVVAGHGGKIEIAEGNRGRLRYERFDPRDPCSDQCRAIMPDSLRPLQRK